MTDKSKQEDKSTWAIPGGLMIGVGVGFFLKDISLWYFVGSAVCGLGLGFIVGAILGLRKEK